MSPAKRPVWDRYVEKIIQGNGGCWIWMSARTRRGYGQISLDIRAQQTHRVAYKMLIGEIPENLVIDHLCRTPWCVNPHHMEPVTQRENVLRGRSPSALTAKRRATKGAAVA